MPNKLLAVTSNAGTYQIEEHKNSSLVVILLSLNSFQHNNYVTLSLFIHTAYRVYMDLTAMLAAILAAILEPKNIFRLVELLLKNKVVSLMLVVSLLLSSRKAFFNVILERWPYWRLYFDLTKPQ